MNQKSTILIVAIMATVMLSGLLAMSVSNEVFASGNGDDNAGTSINTPGADGVNNGHGGTSGNGQSGNGGSSTGGTDGVGTDGAAGSTSQ